MYVFDEYMHKDLQGDLTLKQIPITIIMIVLEKVISKTLFSFLTTSEFFVMYALSKYITFFCKRDEDGMTTTSKK